jgi:hypothetical protein
VGTSQKLPLPQGGVTNGLCEKRKAAADFDAGQLGAKSACRTLWAGLKPANQGLESRINLLKPAGIYGNDIALNRR